MEVKKMKYLKTPIIITIVAALVLSFKIDEANADYGNNYQRQILLRAKNIIFLVPDGMGLAYVTAARCFKNGPDGDPLYLEQFPFIGYQRTHSKNSQVTDSAAAASAWASGAKYNNGEISCHDDDLDGNCDGLQGNTILEIARQAGKKTALVATSDITHATPAAFGAHVHNRQCEEEIARQYLELEIDVLLGGGIAANRNSCKLPHSTGSWLNDLLVEAETKGYVMVGTKSELDAAVDADADKILGLFKAGGKTPETFRVKPDEYTWDLEEPTLPEMVKAMLDTLEEHPRGFFALIEGSQIDWAGHANDIDYLLGEMLAFDAAVKIVKDWIDAKLWRRFNTLVILVADHETGGFGINGPYGTSVMAGDIVEDGWTTGSHTAVDTIVWSQGPGSWKLRKPLQNTDIFDVMVDHLR
jgi:alkaline phosphatase